ncbi:heme-dependent oxidative N-demethylase subunit alpha family protein, partial [Cribrihabitans sp. XS_ASV171]
MILHDRIPHDLTPRKLPGIQPATMETWLHRDEAFAAQMGHRDALIADRRDTVIALDDAARPAAEELLDLVLEAAYPDQGDPVTRPDGVTVAVDRSDPMGTLGRLVQEDLCILQKQGDEHVMTGAVLC